jgi:hypothetical protein
MPDTGDSFITTLREAHLKWGSHRHTSSRGIIYGEGYLQIPMNDARRLAIYNSNQLGALVDYYCNSDDGFLVDVVLKASGSVKAEAIYAKQFQGSGNLKVLGDWFNDVGAEEGDPVQITWTSPEEITIAKI